MKTELKVHTIKVKYNVLNESFNTSINDARSRTLKIR
jgi:hypothetical protein